MSAAQALKAARAIGIRLGIDGDTLTLEADAPPPTALLDLLSRHEAGVVALLRPAHDGWSAKDWLAFFDERAGIAEFDGGLPRADAEALAFACCVTEWLNRNPARSPGRCSAAVRPNTLTTRCCRLATKAPATPGYIRVAGRRGMRAGRPRRLRPFIHRNPDTRTP